MKVNAEKGQLSFLPFFLPSVIFFFQANFSGQSLYILICLQFPASFYLVLFVSEQIYNTLDNNFNLRV